MQYYAVQVKTRGEDEYVRRLRSNPDCAGISFLVPKRTVMIRKKGETKKGIAAVFPGYVFLELAEPLEPDLRWLMRRTPDFYRFLPSNQECLPLTGRDLDLLTHFISFGERADTSRVFFDENEHIVVLEGPLKGLEGFIEKVDRRKRRAKVRLDMCRNSFLIDLAFNVVDRSGKGQPVPHGESRGT
jgi:transcriptional antiterminator NusG